MSIGGLVPRAMKSLPRPHSFSGAFALTLVLATLGGGVVGARLVRPARLGHPPAHAGRGRHRLLQRRRQALVPARRAAPRRAARRGRAPPAPGGGGGGGPSLLPPPRHRPHRARPRGLARTSGSGELAEGGSTLTQQLARTLFLSNRRTWGRKAQGGGAGADARAGAHQGPDPRAVPEPRLPQRRRLRRGGHVAQPLRQAGAATLGLAEAALVAGLIRAPSALSPWCELGRGRARAATSCWRACARRATSRAEAEQAARRTRAAHHRPSARWPTPAPATRRSTCASSSASRSATTTRRTGRCTRRSCPPSSARRSRRWRDGLARARRAGAAGGAGRPRPARRATSWPWWAARDFDAAPFNRAVRSRRQPGSAFKPFVYAAALERGLSPVTVLDRPARRGGGRASRSGRRATRAARRPDEQTLREALLEVQQPGRGRAAAADRQRARARGSAQRPGLRDLPDVPSLALGTGLVTPLELTAAYAVFPNGGFAVRPRGDRARPRRERPAWPSTQRRPGAARAVRGGRLPDADHAARRGGPAAPALGARALGLRFPAAGKTGTTNDFKDAWFVGFSSSMVAGVWVGFDQPEPIGADAYGARVALPIWADFMRRAAPRASARGRSSRRPACTSASCAGCPTCGRWTAARPTSSTSRRATTCPAGCARIHEGSLKQEAPAGARRAAGRHGKEAHATSSSAEERDGRSNEAGRRRAHRPRRARGAAAAPGAGAGLVHRHARDRAGRDRELLRAGAGSLCRRGPEPRHSRPADSRASRRRRGCPARPSSGARSRCPFSASAERKRPRSSSSARWKRPGGIVHVDHARRARATPREEPRQLARLVRPRVDAGHQHPGQVDGAAAARRRGGAWPPPGRPPRSAAPTGTRRARFSSKAEVSDRISR